MAYGMSEAGELILRACRELKDEKLIIRTWGNVSARLSRDLILITPSGRDYDTMTASDLVVVNMDGRHEGDVPPSSETGVHLAAYAARPEVNFVIHTHQPYASALSVLGLDVKLGERVAESARALVGQGIVCADYGPNGSKKINKAVAECLEEHPGTGHVLMRNHGVLCMGTGYEHAFKVTHVLEALSHKIFDYYCNDVIPLTEQIRRFKDEHAEGDAADRAPADESARIRVVQSVPDDVEGSAEHVGQWMLHVRTPYVHEMSRRDATVRAYLDDFAQIAGPAIKCVSAGADRRTLMKAMGSASAVMSENNGAYVTGTTYDEALCVAEVLEKGCMAAYLGTIRGVKPLGTLDAQMNRYKYVRKYSKLKDAGTGQEEDNGNGRNNEGSGEGA